MNGRAAAVPKYFFNMKRPSSPGRAETIISVVVNGDSSDGGVNALSTAICGGVVR